MRHGTSRLPIALPYTLGFEIAGKVHAGEVVPGDVILLFRNQWSLIGSVRATADETEHVVGLVAEGKLQPVVHEGYPLKEEAEAHHELEELRQYGKLILTP